jgi:protein phosphatase
VLIAVADGLGDGGAGRHAADMIVQTLAGLRRIAAHQAASELRRMACSLDHAVFTAAAADSALDGMGSTLICVLIQADQAQWVHAGDSRLYLRRDGALTQITQDQTLARFLLAEGELTPARSAGHYAHQVMDQYIGSGDCKPESGQLDLAPGDLILLCSDGVHKPLANETLALLLGGEGDLKRRAEAILAAALAAGGPDNITLVMGQR